ncbi:MAG: hypothetical protein ABSH48_24405, partial [Verrucomicrobiota bacterium]
ALDPYYSQMQTQITLNGWRGEPEAFVIGGFKTYRKTDIYRDMAKWLHALGWRTRKTSHAHRERKHIIAMVTGRLPSLQGTCSTTTPCSGH